MSVIIIGGGPSGLATAAYLHHFSIPYILLEREDCVAPLWQKYSYDRLHLHLAKQFCELPLMPMPTTYPKYPSRKEFVQYLNDYVSHFEIRPKYRRSVESAAYDESVGKWKIEARNLLSGEIEHYSSRFLVVATGETCDPYTPTIEGMESFKGEILHSTKYKNGENFARKKALVVGSGNSGMEIALDLSNYGAQTSIVVRSPIKIDPPAKVTCNDPTSVGKAHEPLHKGVGIPFLNIRVFPWVSAHGRNKTVRPWDGSGPKRTIYVDGGLGCYKWYQSRCRAGVSARTLIVLRGVDCNDPTSVGKAHEPLHKGVGIPSLNIRVFPWVSAHGRNKTVRSWDGSGPKWTIYVDGGLGCYITCIFAQQFFNLNYT